MSVCINPRLIPFLHKSISRPLLKKCYKKAGPLPATPAPKSKKPKLNGYVAARFTPLETWTHYVCPLGKCDENKTPDRPRMEKLMEAGVGKMKLVFPNKKAGHNEFQSFLEEKFPRLIDGGGRRDLHLVPPGREGYTLAHVREHFSQATVYIRPLQTDLDESPLSHEVSIASHNN